MNRLIALVVGTLFSASAFAVDVVATIVVKYNGQPVYTVQNTFHGMTDEQSRALIKTGLDQFNFAIARQNKESCNVCPYSIEWTWGDNPTLVTERHTFMGVNAILRNGVRWMDQRVSASETNRVRGKQKPWG